MNINKFRFSFFKGEPALQAKFEVRLLNAPVGLLGILGGLTFSYRCSDAELPGKTIATTDFKDYGPARKIAYGALYNDVNLQIIIGEKMDERTMFHRWHDAIIDDNAGSDVAYYDDYVGTFEIKQLDRQGRTTQRIILDEAFPVNVAALPLSWSAQNTTHKLSVDIAYRSFRWRTN